MRQRGSSPKLLALNTVLVSALTGLTTRELRDQPDQWGRLVETAVGAHRVGDLAGTTAEVSYWRDRNDEVDFVIGRGRWITGIEVKSGRRHQSLPGLQAFQRRYPTARPLLVGSHGIPLDEFLLTPAREWIG